MTDLEIQLQLSRLAFDAKGANTGEPPTVGEAELRGIAIEALEELKRIYLRAAHVETKHRDLVVDEIKTIGKTWIRRDIQTTISLMDSSSAGLLLAARLILLRFATVLNDYRQIVPWPQEEPEDETPPSSSTPAT